MNKIELFLQKELQKPKNRLLKELYERNNFSNEELLYLFPNNKLKRFGLPMKKGGAKKKRKKRQMLRSQPMFNIIEDVIEDLLNKSHLDKFFNQFVDYRYLNIGEENVFYVSDNKDNYKNKWEEIKYEYRKQTRYTGINRPSTGIIWKSSAYSK